jgi:excisionase family DNA binding protein
MSTTLVTVEQAAERLRVHPRTVLRYIHEQRLPATRIGKAYRIVRAELDAFAGVASGNVAPSTTARTTCIVDIPRMSPASAEQMATFLNAAVMSNTGEGSPVHLDTAFDPSAQTLKVVVIAGVPDTARVLEMLRLKLDALS